MSYYYTKIVAGSFDLILVKVTRLLSKEGFGVLTQINLQDTFKKKLDIDFKKYTILGACNPSFAYKALQLENKIGAMLPCNIIVQENENGAIEVSAINPMVSMQAVQNPKLKEVAESVSLKLKNIIESL